MDDFKNLNDIINVNVQPISFFIFIFFFSFLTQSLTILNAEPYITSNMLSSYQNSMVQAPHKPVSLIFPQND